MIIDGNRTLLFRCHSCGRLKEYNFNVFDISGRKNVKFKCKCGETNVCLKLSEDRKTVWIEIFCFACQQKHMYRYSLKDFLINDNTFVCMDGIRNCFIGSKDKSVEVIKESKMDFGKLLEEAGFDDYFKNFDILVTCLNKLDTLNEEGKITCDCGSSDISIEVFSDRLELTCLNCGSVKIIYAETENDLDLLLQKENITMHKHAVACIDSIKERDKDIKNNKNSK